MDRNAVVVLRAAGTDERPATLLLVQVQAWVISCGSCSAAHRSCLRALEPSHDCDAPGKNRYVTTSPSAPKPALMLHVVSELVSQHARTRIWHGWRRRSRRSSLRAGEHGRVGNGDARTRAPILPMAAEMP